MGVDVFGIEIEFGREEEMSVFCMGYFLMSFVINLDIYFLL